MPTDKPQHTPTDTKSSQRLSFTHMSLPNTSLSLSLPVSLSLSHTLSLYPPFSLTLSLSLFLSLSLSHSHSLTLSLSLYLSVTHTHTHTHTHTNPSGGVQTKWYRMLLSTCIGCAVAMSGHSVGTWRSRFLKPDRAAVVC